MILNKYDNETYLYPYWEGGIIYHESLAFIKKDNEKVSAKLLFEPENIISLRSSSLEKEYIYGKDYIAEGNEIIILANSEIPVIDYSELFCSEKTFPSRKGDKFYKYIGNKNIILKQVAVTYKHNEKWAGLIPHYCEELLPETCKKLKNKEKLHITFVGDSITVAGDISGMSNVAPFMPRYPEMTVESLKRKTKSEITFDNFAIAGTASNNFFKNEELLNKTVNSKPDLLIIAYGMNDGVEPEEFKDNIKGIFSIVKEKNPLCECIAVSTLIPNRDACWEGGGPIYIAQDRYEEALIELETKGLAVARMTSIYKYLEDKKGFYSVTGNGINHPNDFVVRAYAQTLIAMLTK